MGSCVCVWERAREKEREKSPPWMGITNTVERGCFAILSTVTFLPAEHSCIYVQIICNKTKKKEINFLSHACSAPIDCTVLMHKLHVFKDHLLVVWSEWVARVLLAILINRCRFTSLCVILPTQRFNWLLTLGFMITWSSYQKNKNKRKKRESDPPVSHSTSHLNQTQQWDLCCKIDAVVLHFTGTAFQMHLFVVSACFFLFCFFNMA